MEEGFCSEGGGEVGHREGAGVMVERTHGSKVVFKGIILLE